MLLKHLNPLQYKQIKSECYLFFEKKNTEWHMDFLQYGLSKCEILGNSKNISVL